VGGVEAGNGKRQKTAGRRDAQLPDTVETRMRELFDAQLNLDDKPMSQAQLTEAVKIADVLVPTVTDRIDASLLSHSGEKLRLIAKFRQRRRQYRRRKRPPARHHGDQYAGRTDRGHCDMTMALILAVRAGSRKARWC